MSRMTAQKVPLVVEAEVTLWRAGMDEMQGLREGSRVRLCNVQVGGSPHMRPGDIRDARRGTSTWWAPPEVAQHAKGVSR